MPCTIRVRDGFLVYRLRCHGLPGGAYESQERTGLRETPKNREKLEARARVMSDEMRAGTFDYLRWFPRGAKALHAVVKPDVAPAVPTLREYAEQTWLPRKVPPLVRAWAAHDYRKHLKCHILPAFGDLPLDDVTAAALEGFRAALLKKGLSLKSARNVIDGTLRALLRDARTVDKLVAHDIFVDLPRRWWPRRPRMEPDPFTAEERDALLAYFREKRAIYHPFACTAFWTDARPSELVALRWGDVDVLAAKIVVRRSRTLHEDNATKTEASERTIELAPIVVDLLRRVKPLHADADAFVFLNIDGRPIFGDSFTKHEWHRALRALNLRPRKFYATRHTFISLALTRGARIKWVAEYVGTSVEMIERHYGRYLGADTASQLALLGDEGRESPRRAGRRDSSRNSGHTQGSRRVVPGNSPLRNPVENH